METKKIIFSFLIFPLYLIGTIYETSQFEDLLPHIENGASKRMLVVCDIDNTLVMASDHLGSVAWADHLIAHLEKKGVPRQQAHQIQNILWKNIQPYVKVKLVDPKAAGVIKEIQKRNIPLVALTARSPDESENTSNQLLSVDIDLSSKLYGVASKTLPMEKEAASFYRGILFCTTSNPKSKVLFAFLSAQSQQPDCILFVDDKLSHLECVSQACKERNIGFIGIRFSGADEFVKRFDPRLAEIQWAAFPPILTDEQARNILRMPIPARS